MTATFQTPRTGTSPAGSGPLRLIATTSRRRQRRQPLIQLSWRVMLPDGRTLGWVQLVHIRDTGRSVWGAAAPYGGWVPIRTGGRRQRGRDAVIALLIHHGLQEVPRS